MAFIDDKKSVMKEIQQIKGLLEQASKRADRLSVEFCWDCEESPCWVEDLYPESISKFLDALSETSAENARTMERLNVMVSNGRASRGGDARS